MRSIEQINNEWMRGESIAFEAYHDLFPHLRRDTVDSVVREIDGVLRARLAAYAKAQPYDVLIENCRERGEPVEHWLALRDWVQRGCP